MQTKLTPSDKRNIIELHETKGLGSKKLASQYHVNPKTIKDIIRRYKYNGEKSIEKERKRYTEEEKQYALSLYKEGMSIAEIAGRLNAERITVKLWIKKYGIVTNQLSKK